MGTYALLIIITIVITFVLIAVYFTFRHVIHEKFESSPNIFSKLYFDNNGTTKPYPQVYEEMKKFSCCGNLSAKYAKEAQNMISDTENILCNWLGSAPAGLSSSKNRVIWTSGASESNNLFLRGVVDTFWLSAPVGSRQPHIILSAIEHKTSIECSKQLAALGRAEITFIEPKLNGTIEPMDVAYAIQPHTIAISIMHINNETGSMNDIKALAYIAQQQKILFHTDVVQSVGKWSQILAGLDACASISFHKLYGPTGIGALVLTPTANLKICPQVCGSQNDGLRGGTENISAIAGARVAMIHTFNNRMKKNEMLFSMREFIIGQLSAKFSIGSLDTYVNRSDSFYIPRSTLAGEILFFGDDRPNNTILMSFIRFGPLAQHFCNIKLRDKLLETGVIISIGSTCNTSSKNPSHVLISLKMPFIVRCGVIRISLGDYNTMDQCSQFCKKIIPLVEEQFR